MARYWRLISTTNDRWAHASRGGQRQPSSRNGLGELKMTTQVIEKIRDMWIFWRAQLGYFVASCGAGALK
jgi:hypothetical protein